MFDLAVRDYTFFWCRNVVCVIIACFIKGLDSWGNGNGLNTPGEDSRFTNDCYNELDGDFFDFKLFFTCPNIPISI